MDRPAKLSALTTGPIAELVAVDEFEGDPAHRLTTHIRVLPRSRFADVTPCARLVRVIAEPLKSSDRLGQIFDQHPDVLYALGMMSVQKVRIDIRWARRR